MSLSRYVTALLISVSFCHLASVFAEQVPLQQSVKEQHEQLIPVVAVADMFFACHRATQSDGYQHVLDDLVTEMDRNTLADKLITCLDGHALKSDVALNYGLIGCFHAQMKALSEHDYQQKMAELLNILPALARAERQKTFTQCVTEQAINYLD
jgi:hypothetical protein